jgi:RNA polymerase sigma factor (sigma-70 family)
MSRKTLTADEERDLFRRWKAGDEDAGNEIVEAFRAWVVTIALNYCGGNRDDEIIAAGLEGLADAMRQFDLTRKHAGRHVRFNSFARLVVNQTIQRQLTARTRSTGHLSFCGATLPEKMTDTVIDESIDGTQKECVGRLIHLVMHHEDLQDRTKQILKLFIEQPAATLKAVGEKVGMTREGVRQHLLRIRAIVLDDPELAGAAIEAGLNLGRAEE